LLDEGTAAAEAMTMLFGQKSGNKGDAFFVSSLCLPQTIDLLKTRAEPIGIEIIVGDHQSVDVTDTKFFGMLLQYPAANGEVFDYKALVEAAKENDIQGGSIQFFFSKNLSTVVEDSVYNSIEKENFIELHNFNKLNIWKNKIIQNGKDINYILNSFVSYGKK
jgi:hypothetical protein